MCDYSSRLVDALALAAVARQVLTPGGSDVPR